MNQTDLLQTILKELANIQSSLPKGELQAVLKRLDDMGEEISDIKDILLNPEDGLVVKVNKNSDFRRQREGKITYCDSQFQEISELKRWKNGVTKALWIIFTALVGILVKLLFLRDVTLL